MICGTCQSNFDGWLAGFGETDIRCYLLFQECEESPKTIQMTVISVWLTFQGLEKLEINMT